MKGGVVGLGIGALVVAGAFTLLASGRAPLPAAASPALGVPARLVDILLTRDVERVQALVPARATLASVLKLHNLVEADVRAVVDAVSKHVDLRRFRAGQPYHLEWLRDGRLNEFLYELDRDRMIQIRRQSPNAPAFAAAVLPIPKTMEVVTIEGWISPDRPSLIQAIEAAGEHLELSLRLAEIFGGQIDFNNDLQSGDTFKLVIERGRREDGAFAGYGPVLAAEFVNDGDAYRALRYAAGDGPADYYDEQGRSLKRFFLKSPLKFEPRVTSSFSRARRHPVLQYTRAHNGVDYAAPRGAPVVSVAAGTVTFAGWAGGGGRTVRIRHAGGYDSEYMHLSAIERAVTVGGHVAQGATLGRVGASGLATGPHLHYGLKRNGAYLNPVQEHARMPPGEPIAGPHLATFQAERDRLFATMTRPTEARATN